MGYVDNDYAGCVDNRRSITSWIYTFVGFAISWRSVLQNFMLVSTTKAKYVASSEACKETIWLTCLVGYFGLEQKLPILHNDSQSV